MKKILLYTFALIVASLAFSSCNDDKDELTDTKVTYYADIELSDPDPYTMAIGSSYKDPGYKATLNGTDVTDGVTVTSNVDPNTLGVYSVTYSYTNAEGFTTSTTRTVIVYDPSSDPDLDLTGDWVVVSPSTRTSPSAIAFSGYTITLVKMAQGIYYCTDFMGGWYAQRAGYGNSYAMYGYFAVDGDNNISVLYSHINGWGDSLDATSGPIGSYNAETNQIFWSVSYYDTYLAWDIYLDPAE